MGGLETEAKKIRRRGQIQKALLTTLLIGGMIAIGATPRINILKLLGNKKRNQYRLKHQVNDALIRLSRKGLVAFVIKDGRKFARLTPTEEALGQALASYYFRHPRAAARRAQPAPGDYAGVRLCPVARQCLGLSARLRRSDGFDEGGA